MQHPNISLLLGRMETRQHAEFTSVEFVVGAKVAAPLGKATCPVGKVAVSRSGGDAGCSVEREAR
jgi:hypothetical protein